MHWTSKGMLTEFVWLVNHAKIQAVKIALLCKVIETHQYNDPLSRTGGQDEKRRNKRQRATMTGEKSDWTDDLDKEPKRRTSRL